MSREIVRSSSQGLAVRSATLVARGLRDLTRQSNWLCRRIFDGHAFTVAVSSAGQVCAIAPFATPEALIYDVAGNLQENDPPHRLAVPETSAKLSDDLRGVCAWSPTDRYLVAALTGWKPQLHIFDRRNSGLPGTFCEFSAMPRVLAWSNNEKYFVMATENLKNSALQLWQAEEKGTLFGGKPASALAASDSMERQTYEAEFGDEGAFSGYGCKVFSPDDRLLASVVEIRGDWADDSILLLDAPSLRKRDTHAARGHVTSLAWTPDSKQIVYCGAGQAYRLAIDTNEVEDLPFGAEMCAYHPGLPVCLFFSSWTTGSSQGRLFLVDMNRLSVYDEHDAEGVSDLRWSSDGTKAFAVTRDGHAYVYEPSIL